MDKCSIVFHRYQIGGGEGLGGRGGGGGGGGGRIKRKWDKIFEVTLLISYCNDDTIQPTKQNYWFKVNLL